MPARKSEPPPPPQPRILTPQDAKRLANPDKTPEPLRRPSKFPRPIYPSKHSSLSAKPGAEALRKRLVPSLVSALHEHFTGLRERYAALPTPVRRTLGALQIFGTILPIGLFFSGHVAQVMRVRGGSMTPYLNEDYERMQTKSDVVLINLWPRWVWPWEGQRRLERGMLVTFRSPGNPKHIALKRVIGLPGDRIITREPCMKPTQIVPYNHVWLEGDAEDPRKTLDSNTYGPVSISLLTGRAIAVLRPRMRWLDWKDWEGEGSAEEGKDVSRYRQSVRDRVVKEAVRLETPALT